jgi:hypothetical protein
MKNHILINLFILTTYFSSAQISFDPENFSQIVKKNGLSEALNVFRPEREKRYIIDGKKHTIGAGFQPSVLLDPKGIIHIFSRENYSINPS